MTTTTPSKDAVAASKQVADTLIASHSFTGGHGPQGEFVSLHFPSRATRKAFLDAYVHLIQFRAAIIAERGQ